MAKRDRATGLSNKGFALLEKMRKATPLQTLLMAIQEAQRDPAMRRALMTSLELETTQWRQIYDAIKEIGKPDRIALAALRKIKRIREAEDEAGEIARTALKRIGA